MTADVLLFPDSDADVALEPDQEVAIEPDAPPASEPDPAIELDPPAGEGLMARPLVEVLPADFPLSPLMKFIPNPALRRDADQAAAYALRVEVTGEDGLSRADMALTTVRATLTLIDEHFAQPVGIAYALHKRLTTMRGEWRAQGDAVLDRLGKSVYAERKRLDAIAAEQRRKDQEAADRAVRDAARREAEAAAHAQAPAPIVEELKRQAETATAPPVPPRASGGGGLRGNTPTVNYKTRLIGTPGSEEPNPDIEVLTTTQRAQVLVLLHAIVEGRAPLAAVTVNWSYLNKRAKADKTTLAIPGIEVFDEGGLRAKSTRTK